MTTHSPALPGAGGRALTGGGSLLSRGFPTALHCEHGSPLFALPPPPAAPPSGHAAPTAPLRHPCSPSPSPWLPDSCSPAAARTRTDTLRHAREPARAPPPLPLYIMRLQRRSLPALLFLPIGAGRAAGVTSSPSPSESTQMTPQSFCSLCCTHHLPGAYGVPYQGGGSPSEQAPRQNRALHPAG